MKEALDELLAKTEKERSNWETTSVTIGKDAKGNDITVKGKDLAMMLTLNHEAIKGDVKGLIDNDYYITDEYAKQISVQVTNGTRNIDMLAHYYVRETRSLMTRNKYFNKDGDKWKFDEKAGKDVLTEKNGWEKYGKITSSYHKPHNNHKFVNKKTGEEIVMTQEIFVSEIGKEEMLVQQRGIFESNPRWQGTFNFSTKTKAHGKLDVVPYEKWKWGNHPTSKSSKGIEPIFWPLKAYTKQKDFLKKRDDYINMRRDAIFRKILQRASITSNGYKE